MHVLFKKLMVGITVLAALGWSSMLRVDAAGAPPPPPPANPPAVPPSLLAYVLGTTQLPYDFRFHERLYGQSFKPGEHVTIRAQHLNAGPWTVTADSNGSFTLDATYDWRFCGPGGSAAAAFVLQASGDKGTTVQWQPLAPLCPSLTASLPQAAAPAPSQGPAPATPAPTALPGGIAIPPPPSGPPVLVTPSNNGKLQKATVYGFGFLPGERVSVKATGATGLPKLARKPLMADAQGRFKLSFNLAPSATCASSANARLQAVGNSGTAASVLLTDVLPAAQCASADTAAPAPAPSIAIHALSVRVRPAQPHPGASLRALVQASQSSVLRLEFHFQRGTVQRATVTARLGKTATVTIHLPRSVHRGTASVRLLTASGTVLLTDRFTVH